MSKIRNNRLLLFLIAVVSFTPPEERVRRKRSNQLIRASPELVAAEDNDLVLVDLSERHAPTSHRSQNTITPSSSASPSPSAGLSDNQHEPSFTTVSTRPHRAAADHARHPGFFRLAYFYSDSDVE